MNVVIFAKVTKSIKEDDYEDECYNCGFKFSTWRKPDDPMGAGCPGCGIMNEVPKQSSMTEVKD